MRQIANEAHGVRHDRRCAARQTDAPHGRIQGSEQLVSHVGRCPGQRAKQRGFTGVRVPHQRQGGNRNLHARAPPGLTLQLDALQALAQHLDPLAQQAPIGFQLGFTRAAHADTALLALQVSPAPHQAAGQMLQLREFHLELALEAAGALREDVEDETVAIQHPSPGMLFEIALLAGRERMIDEDQVRIGGDRGVAQLIGLAGADKEF
jgi:hypothetical protein